MPTLFDSHCHFDFEAFDHDRSAVWQSCQSAGIGQLMIPGVAPAQWSRAARIAGECPGIYHSAGLHPWWLNGFLDGQALDRNREAALLDSLTEALQAPGCLAVGECGLDMNISTPLAVQKKVLTLHLEVARSRGLPVILHNVRAHNPLLRLLKAQPLPRGGVLHAFSGSVEMAREYWSLGFYLGIGGTITYPRARKTRSAVAQMPLEALVLETDAPDMPLCGHQGERNSPEQLARVAQELAQLRNLSPADVARQTTANSRTLFGLTDQGESGHFSR